MARQDMAVRWIRENHLLSPYRNRPKPARKHDGKIITMAPDLMWGTDGTRVFTLEEGWVWIFYREICKNRMKNRQAA